MKENPANNIEHTSFLKAIFEDGSQEADVMSVVNLKYRVSRLIKQIELEQKENGLADFKICGVVENLMRPVVMEALGLVIAGVINGEQE